MRIVRQIMADRTSGNLSVALLAVTIVLQGLFAGFTATVAQAHTNDFTLVICLEHGSATAVQPSLPDPEHYQDPCRCGVLCAAMGHGLALLAPMHRAATFAQRVLYAGAFVSPAAHITPSTLHFLREARGPPAIGISSLPV